MATARKRTRKTRAIATEQANAKEDSMRQLAAEFFRENKAMNAAKSKAEKARKALYKMMKDNNLKTLSFDTSIDGKTVSLDATISTPSGTAMDVAKLYKTLPFDEFISIVTASAKSVGDKAGKEIVAQVSVSTTGTENVSVKPKS